MPLLYGSDWVWLWEREFNNSLPLDKFILSRVWRLWDLGYSPTKESFL